ncbi:FAD-binding domain-containing protein [Phlegmacium glaucopus]|nr:FAD-binding domain-containing protein [Phlegmacium glaucopus]
MSVSASHAATETCTNLQATLGSDIVQLSGTKYLTAASNAWSLFNTDNTPTCIVFPTETYHVQVAMAAIFHANILYAVQAGGHSAMTGWNTVQNGVLFLFSEMKNVTYDATKDTITLQPGVHWDEALAELEPLGVAPIGGRLGDVGTGLLLGGGLSYLSGEHGFSADNYRELDVVLVSGELVTATATNHYADLFRSLKGGANRFGIVTRYEVEAIHTGTNLDKNWFGGIISYPNSSAEALIHATEKYVRTVSDPKAAILVGFANLVNASSGVVTTSHFSVLFYHGSELPSAIFQDFLSIPAEFGQLSPMSYLEANNVLGSGSNRGFGELFFASAFNSSAGVGEYMSAFRHVNDYVSSINKSVFGTVLAFTPILDSQILAGREKGGNVIDPPRGNYVAIQVQTQFPSGVLTLSPKVKAARKLLQDQMPRSPGIPLYINECDASQNVFATYGRLEEMKQTYAKYDPTRFNVRFTDGPIGL